MLRAVRALPARFGALIRSDAEGVRAGFVAHLLATVTGLVAGLTLGSITGTLAALPGLIVLVPAAVGLRGNVFGALGSRLGTLVATGTFTLSRRRDTPVGQNIQAAIALSLGMSVVLAVVAKLVAEAFSVPGAISLSDFVVVSLFGGLIPTAVVMAITIGLASTGVRRGWDIDNVTAPVVTAAGDMVTLPSLFLATFLVRDTPGWVSLVLAVPAAIVGLGFLVESWRSSLGLVRRVARESVPFLVAAGTLSTLAGVTVQGRLGPMVRDPAILVVLPPLLSISGSLAGILSARVSTKLHLGLVDPNRFSAGSVSEDIALVYVVGIPIFVVLGVAADALSAVFGLGSPGWLSMLALLMLAGVLATLLSTIVGYFGALLTYRLGWDPDNNGIPIVSSASDFLGAVALIVSLVILGLT